jgi:hypothetical protein
MIRHLDAGWEVVHGRGMQYNIGEVLKMATREISAQKGGRWSDCPSVAWHANSPANNGDREKSNAFPKSEYKFGNTISNPSERIFIERADLQSHSSTKVSKKNLSLIR